MKNQILNRAITNIMLGNIDPAILLKTRFDCHVKGLHSIPIDEKDGKLTRIFFTTSDHTMYNNGMLSDMSLGAHNHRYNIRLEGLFGNPLNIMIQPNAGSGCILHSFKYQDGEKMAYQGITQARIESVEKIGDIFMPAHQVHTVYVPQYEKAAWLVEEGKTVADTVNLYSAVRQPVCKFRQAETLEEIQEFLGGWLC